MTTRAEVISDAAICLAAEGVPEPVRDARLLYRWVAGLSGAGLQAGLMDQAKSGELVRFSEAIAQRKGRRPVAYITGVREFWSQSFWVTPDVLDPRPETETLVEEALKEPASRVLDLGTGSGCVLLSILANMPGAVGVGVDISEAALTVAEMNAKMLGLATRTDFQNGGWDVKIGGDFDMIVSNPPYLDAEEMRTLPPELAFEPPIALSSGGDGLGAYRAIISIAPDRLVQGGRLIMEIGVAQATRVWELFVGGSFVDIHIFQDMDGRNRLISGRKKTNFQHNCFKGCSHKVNAYS